LAHKECKKKRAIDSSKKEKNEVKERLQLCVHLVSIGDSNDCPVSADQSRRQTRLSRDEIYRK